MANYHQTVTRNATPFGEFTKWCDSASIHSMDDIQDLRRAALRAYIKENDYSVNAFAIKLGRQASFFSDLFRGKKSFRESLAEKLEKEIKQAKLPKVRLIDPGSAASSNQEFERGLSGSPVFTTLAAREFTQQELLSMRAHLVDLLSMIDNKMIAIEVKSTAPREVLAGSIVEYEKTHPNYDHSPHHSAHGVAERIHPPPPRRTAATKARTKKTDEGYSGNDRAHEVS